jgi:hypothetical protein
VKLPQGTPPKQGEQSLDATRPPNHCHFLRTFNFVLQFTSAWFTVLCKYGGFHVVAVVVIAHMM